ncbi:MAG TPA: undecaprenyl-phosphate galactose phosphotransferase WbaP [Thermodesulfovibrionales bacterium]|nr:undecaprenyl-phosphate galactose phosphotransferase WbaP [Thermodesulfovibrionales bacterium]
MREIAKFVRGFLQMSCLIGLDLSAFYLSLFLAWAFRVKVLADITPQLPVFPFSYFILLWWIPLLYVCFMAYEALYTSNLPFWDETRNTVKALSLAALTVLAIVTLGRMSERISRLVILGMWACSLLVFPLLRLWGKKALHAVGIWKERVLILGAGNAGRLVMEGIQRERHMGYDVIGFLDDDEQKKGMVIGSRRVFGKIKYFPKYVKTLGINTVIIALPSLPAERLSALTSLVQNYAVNTMLIPNLKGIALLNTELFHLFYEQIFLMNIRNNLKSLANRAVKRGFDLAVCVISFPFLIPLIGIISAFIKLETPGPAVYAHDRIGKDGKIFRCYKFRTMERNAEEKLKGLLENNEDLRREWEKTWKLKEDPRVTRIGKFLRMTSLDELPQILNVFRGEMSLVGPRPYLLRERNELGKNMQVICSARPGITGLWQVSGRSNVSCEFRIKLDSWYIMNWSLWFDIAILFKTMKVVAGMEGAY